MTDQPKRAKTGGRKAGTPNKATADIKAAARLHGAAMIDRLAEIALDREEDSRACVAAARELLDRGYGKATQPVDGDGEGGPVNVACTWLPPVG